METCTRRVTHWLPRLQIYVCQKHLPAGEDKRDVREDGTCEWHLQGTDQTQARRFVLRAEALKRSGCW